jgi:hypothetical protein
VADRGPDGKLRETLGKKYKILNRKKKNLNFLLTNMLKGFNLTLKSPKAGKEVGREEKNSQLLPEVKRGNGNHSHI